MNVRLAIAYSLLALLIAAAASTIAWLRYNSRTQRELRRRRMQADLNRALAMQGPNLEAQSKDAPKA